MKSFRVTWWKPDDSGPEAVHEWVDANSRAKAVAWGKSIAKERGWRYMETYAAEKLQELAG